jgi:two-component system, LytTR family, response regulator LytT
MTFRQQLLFWLIMLLMLTLLFGQGITGMITSFYFVCMLLPVAIGTSFVFNEVLVPRFLITRRFWLFGLYFIYSMVISLWAQMIVITIAFIVLAEFHTDQLNPNIMNIRLLALAVYGLVFLQAFLNMYKSFISLNRSAAELRKEQENIDQGFLIVKADRKQYRINYLDILYVESLSDYVRFVLSEGESVSTRETISRLEKRLPKTFVRIHRSFIVRKEAIRSYTKEEVFIGEYILPVGRKYKRLFVKEVMPV